MTAITFSSPLSAQPRRAPRRESSAPATVRPGRARRVAETAPLRLTRRGRLAITGLLATCGLAASMFVGGVGFAGTDAEHPSVSFVTVAPGETLWSIAGEVAPNADRRDTVAQILELNALSSSAVRAGARLAVPAH
jgi:Tfp pilus assembly protein FimV